MSNNIILSVRNLKTFFPQEGKELRAVNGISFDMKKGKTVCLVGESGCGKSMTALSIMGLVPSPGRVVEGTIMYKNINLLDRKKNLWKYRGKDISMIFQDPMTSLNPVMKVGRQISEGFMIHDAQMTKAEAKNRSIEMLRMVHIPEPETRYDEYPHQMSGGMRQRVMIAMALACRPEILICDEPTTALDVTVQAQIMKLIVELQGEIGMSVLLITHDMGVVSEMADEIYVLYAGRVVEIADREEMFQRQLHPYSESLLKAIPKIGNKNSALYSIPGMVPKLTEDIQGCIFYERCSYKTDTCAKNQPTLKEINGKRKVACFRYE